MVNRYYEWARGDCISCHQVIRSSGELRIAADVECTHAKPHILTGRFILQKKTLRKSMSYLHRKKRKDCISNFFAGAYKQLIISTWQKQNRKNVSTDNGMIVTIVFLSREKRRHPIGAGNITLSLIHRGESGTKC